MANWKYKIDVAADFNLVHEGAITIQELSQRMVAHLKALPCYNTDSDLQGIVLEFELLANEPNTEVEEFDYVLNTLYDWGDKEVPPYKTWPPNKQCWIGTF